jgi:hypothetical protein
MTKFTLLGVAAILSTTLPTQVLAQTVPFQHRAVADAMAFAPPSRSTTPGKEMTTRPWSAPVGHRQPGVTDVPASTSVPQQTFDQEDANVDRIVRSICRGC